MMNFDILAQNLEFNSDEYYVWMSVTVHIESVFHLVSLPIHSSGDSTA
jgi:hypothetical protein